MEILTDTTNKGLINPMIKMRTSKSRASGWMEADLLVSMGWLLLFFLPGLLHFWIRSHSFNLQHGFSRKKVSAALGINQSSFSFIFFQRHLCFTCWRHRWPSPVFSNSFIMSGNVKWENESLWDVEEQNLQTYTKMVATSPFYTSLLSFGT